MTKNLDLMSRVSAGPWPRDEWVVGDGVTADGRAREYVIHLVPPRFVARVVGVEYDGRPWATEEPADVVSGITYSVIGAVLCEIDWIDEPDPGEIVQLLDAANAAIDDISQRG